MLIVIVVRSNTWPFLDFLKPHLNRPFVNKLPHFKLKLSNLIIILPNILFNSLLFQILHILLNFLKFLMCSKLFHHKLIVLINFHNFIRIFLQFWSLLLLCWFFHCFHNLNILIICCHFLYWFCYSLYYCFWYALCTCFLLFAVIVHELLYCLVVLHRYFLYYWR